MSLNKEDRIALTGGGGFLGSFVLEELARRGYGNVVSVRRRDYDLTHEADVERFYDNLKPQIVLHLAAEVGGIGANRDNPGRYFFANLAMGLHLIDNMALDDLAERCAAAGRWEFLFTMAPLRIERGTGCPVNPVGVL